tara:strand:+ start:26 stop:514 length:489 start_codon:yes stop_codon:yes gene_type:complete
MKLFFLISSLFILNVYPFTKLKADLISNKKLFDTFIDLNYKSGEFLRLLIADDSIEKELGLMGIKSLDPNSGMIFVFNPQEKVNFWMKNTLIPLDIIFIKNDRIIEILHNVLPCAVDECPLFGPREKVDFVIELNSGRAKELGFEIGSKISLNKKFNIKSFD